MLVAQHTWSPVEGWLPAAPAGDADLVLAFVPPDADPETGVVKATALAAAFPRAVRVTCTAGGQIAGTRVLDDVTVVTAVRFERTRVRAAATHHREGEDGHVVGARLAAALPVDVDGAPLRHVLVFSDGVLVNGSALVRGLTGALPADVTASGGLAADGDRFARTRVGLDGPSESGLVAAVGLYGDALEVGLGTLGGWVRFGPDRRVTRAEGAVLHELDGEPALALYKRYLGALAAELPGSALRFPLALRTRDGDTGVVRTVVGVDEEAGTLRFAGDVPDGTIVRLVRASNDGLVDGAAGAAAAAVAAHGDDAPALALLVSCVGRRWVLGQHVEEELEAVRDAIGADVPLAGFYSYGEIAPVAGGGACELHNQTMTVTTLRERVAR